MKLGRADDTRQVYERMADSIVGQGIVCDNVFDDPWTDGAADECTNKIDSEQFRQHFDNKFRLDAGDVPECYKATDLAGDVPVEEMTVKSKQDFDAISMFCNALGDQRYTFTEAVYVLAGILHSYMHPPEGGGASIETVRDEIMKILGEQASAVAIWREVMNDIPEIRSAIQGMTAPRAVADITPEYLTKLLEKLKKPNTLVPSMREMRETMRQTTRVNPRAQRRPEPRETDDEREAKKELEDLEAKRLARKMAAADRRLVMDDTTPSMEGTSASANRPEPSEYEAWIKQKKEELAAIEDRIQARRQARELKTPQDLAGIEERGRERKQARDFRKAQNTLAVSSEDEEDL